MFSKFNENDSLNQKNNKSMSDLSGYVSVYFLFNSSLNFLLNLTNLNSFSMLFSSIFSQYGFKQHLSPNHVFSPLFPLSFNLSHPPIVDSPCTDTEFEKLFFQLAYESPTSSPSSSNTPIDSSTVLKEFAAFYELSFHVFSFFFLYYYSLH
jgi:hypothetical protein